MKTKLPGEVLKKTKVFCFALVELNLISSRGEVFSTIKLKPKSFFFRYKNFRLAYAGVFTSQNLIIQSVFISMNIKKSFPAIY